MLKKIQCDSNYKNIYYIKKGDGSSGVCTLKFMLLSLAIMSMVYSIFRRLLIGVILTSHVAALQFVDTDEMDQSLKRFQDNLKFGVKIVQGNGENKYNIKPQRRCILLNECIDHLENSADTITVLQEERMTLMEMSEALLTKVHELENRNKLIDKTKLTIKDLEDKIRELQFYNDIHIHQIMNTDIRPQFAPQEKEEKINVAQIHLDSLESKLELDESHSLESELEVDESHSLESEMEVDESEAWETEEEIQYRETHSSEVPTTITTTMTPVPQKVDKCIEICNNFVKDITLNISSAMGVHYFHSDLHSQKTWFEAQYFCRQHGMELITIDSEEKNIWTEKQIWDYTNGTEEIFYWTGLHNMNDKISWIWTGTGLNALYLNWKVGQPFSPSLQRCAGFSQTNNNNNNIGWIANFCNKKGLFICQMYEPCASILNN